MPIKPIVPYLALAGIAVLAWQVRSLRREMNQAADAHQQEAEKRRREAKVITRLTEDIHCVTWQKRDAPTTA